MAPSDTKRLRATFASNDLPLQRNFRIIFLFKDKLKRDFKDSYRSGEPNKGKAREVLFSYSRTSSAVYALL